MSFEGQSYDGAGRAVLRRKSEDGSTTGHYSRITTLLLSTTAARLGAKTRVSVRSLEVDVPADICSLVRGQSRKPPTQVRLTSTLRFIMGILIFLVVVASIATCTCNDICMTGIYFVVVLPIASCHGRGNKHALPLGSTVRGTRHVRKFFSPPCRA